MNITILIATLVALLGGFAAGSAFTTKDSLDAIQITNQAQERILNENPKAEDFVSLRPSITALPSETLSLKEREGLLLMREEEKLARDVYQTLYEKWGLKIFSNIAQSEQTHTEAVRDLLLKYRLEDPVTDDTIGVFTNRSLQELYDTLITEGIKSETDALIVGAIIEDLDIRDLQDLLVQSDNQDITLVYENLIRGSQKHLRAFTRQLTQRGEAYVPKYISVVDYQNVIANDQETSSRKQNGGHEQGSRGWGMQKGQ